MCTVLDAWSVQVVVPLLLCFAKKVSCTAAGVPYFGEHLL